MGLHTITMPVRGDGKGANVLAHAASLAKRFGAHLQVLHCRARPEDMLPFGVPVPAFMREQIAASAGQLADSEEETLRHEFRDRIAKAGLEESVPVPGRATASFREAQGKQIDVIRHYGRLADVICVPKPDRDRNLGANTLKAALFNSGRPVMMCPPREDAVPDTFGRHIAIGWNGSIEATRALALGMPLVEAAETVTILTGGAEIHGATAEELVDYLALRGATAQIDRFKPRSGVGRLLLEHAAGAGADILLMGAYHDSHERETVLGGNTQVVVDHSTMPVVLVH